MKTRKYETVVIARPEFDQTQIKDLVARLKERVERNQGQVLEVVDWGVRKLAYPIRLRGEKFFYGYYFLLVYSGNFQGINEMEGYMKLIDDVVRFQTVRISDTVEKVELAEPVWREQNVPELKVREEGEGLETVEPSRQRKLSREEMYRPKVADKVVSAEAGAEKAAEGAAGTEVPAEAAPAVEAAPAEAVAAPAEAVAAPAEAVAAPAEAVTAPAEAVTAPAEAVAVPAAPVAPAADKQETEEGKNG